MKGSWREVINDCRATVSKPPLDKEPSESFKRSILIAEHSPIRDISFRWRWEGIKNWIATHWVRHKWESFVSTQRTDRTGVNRDDMPQSAPVNFTGEANVQALIDTMRKRLCYQAAPETREYAEDLKLAIMQSEPEIGAVLVPNCVYRAGCPELYNCGYFAELYRESGLIQSDNIELRYAVYNKHFLEECNDSEGQD